MKQTSAKVVISSIKPLDLATHKKIVEYPVLDKSLYETFIILLPTSQSIKAREIKKGVHKFKLFSLVLKELKIEKKIKVQVSTKKKKYSNISKFKKDTCYLPNSNRAYLDMLIRCLRNAFAHGNFIIKTRNIELYNTARNGKINFYLQCSISDLRKVAKILEDNTN